MYEIRRPINNLFGQLSAPATISDTTLTSPSFATLPTDYSTSTPGIYLPLTLKDDALGVYEIVYVTGHVGGSNNITVVRGREGSTARAWAASSAFQCAPTIRDTITPYTRAGLPGANDAHWGMRAYVTDEGYRVVEYSGSGWYGSAKLLVRTERGTDVVNGGTETVLDTVTAYLYKGVRYRTTKFAMHRLVSGAAPTYRMRYLLGNSLVVAGSTNFFVVNPTVGTTDTPLNLDGTFSVTTSDTYTVGLTAASTNDLTISGTRRFQLWDTGGN